MNLLRACARRVDLGRALRRSLPALLVVVALVHASHASQSLGELLQGGTKPQEPTPTDRPLDKDAIQARRDAAASQLEQDQARLTEARAAQEETRATELVETVDARGRLVLLFDQQLQVLAELEDLVEALAEAESKLGAAGTEAAQEAVPVREWDALFDEVRVSEERLRVLEDEVALEQQSRQDTRNQLDERERRVRAAREGLANAKDAQQRAAATHEVDVAELRAAVARALVELRTLRLEESELARKREQLLLDTARARLARSQDLLVFSEEARQQIDAELDELESTLEAQRLVALSKLRDSDASWMRSKVDVSTAPPEDEFLPLYREELEYARQSKERWKAEARMLEERSARIGERRKVWESRYLAMNGAEPEAIRLAVEESRAAIDQLETEEDQLRLQLEPLRKNLRQLQASLEVAVGESVTEKRILEQRRLQATQLAARIAALEDGFAGLEALRRLHEKLVAQFGVTERSIRDWAKLAWRKTIEIWNGELTTIEEKPIRLRQVVIGLLILTLGLKSAGLLARLIGTRLLPRFGVEPAAAIAVRTMLFYVFVVTFVLFALRIVNVPLTVFTVLGGALAIGVGFGSQNIVNNFISGLILLVEQPIRVGDLIRVGELYGTVERIGARSTRVRTGQNIEIMVPNSSFLESNVVNLTLTDNKIRTSVSVGVAYGSPVRDVVRLLKTAAEEHGRVLNSPEPRVLFADFGDNSLGFELHFWIRTNQVMDRLMIESDIRSKIDALFRGSSITIAFPQRDIHFDTLEPLRVRILKDEEEEDAEEEAAKEAAAKPRLPG